MSRWRWAAGAAAAGLALALPWALAPLAEPGEPASPALRSLRSPDYDPRFGLGYWAPRIGGPEGDAKTSEALRFCRAVPLERHPNCRTVLLLDAAARMPGFVGAAP
ncbi:MAG TPA: hypothetical protein VJG13_11340 [Thermoanaerobaculia bacterium]|nr:hypothetical protein [Thermoanaerobaculia bacterium]